MCYKEESCDAKELPHMDSVSKSARQENRLGRAGVLVI